MKRFCVVAIALLLPCAGCPWIFSGAPDEVTLELDEHEVACAEDRDCAIKCDEGDAASCVDGLCDGCTRRTIDCTIDGAECVENCEEGEDAECDPDYLTCNACTPKWAGNSP